MSDTLSAQAPADRLFDHVAGGRAQESYRLVETLSRAGWDVERIVVDLLTVVQRRVGCQWQAGAWTVAQEHQATALVDDLLGLLGRDIAPPRSHGTVTLVCAEGEWHVTPARMAALLLRRHGWRTSFLGGSTPSDHVRRSLEVSRPSFVAISCTLPLALVGAWRVAAVARSLGLPTIAGGAAFGDDDTRARRLGIDGWAPDIATASTLLYRWLDRPPTPMPAPVGAGAFGDSELRPLQRWWTSVGERTIATLANAVPPAVVHEPGALDRLRRDLDELLRTAYLAGVCDDPRLFADGVEWLLTLRPARELPHAAVHRCIEVMHALTAPRDGATHRALGDWLAVTDV